MRSYRLPPGTGPRLARTAALDDVLSVRAICTSLRAGELRRRDELSPGLAESLARAETAIERCLSLFAALPEIPYV